MLKRYLGTKKFYKEVSNIALPIMGQQFITTFVYLIDNVMIGSIGNIALTSVTVANRFFLIVNSVLFGLCGAAGIYIAQYYGAKKKEKCQEVFNINMVFSIGAAILFTLAMFLIPKFAIQLFSQTPVIVKSRNSCSFNEYNIELLLDIWEFWISRVRDSGGCNCNFNCSFSRDDNLFNSIV